MTHLHRCHVGIMEAVAEELKFEQQQQSPTNSLHFSFSRSGSTGSVHAISCSSASSAQNTGEDRQMGGRTGGRTDGGWTDARTGGRTTGQTGGRTDGWVGNTGGWMGGVRAGGRVYYLKTPASTLTH